MKPIFLSVALSAVLSTGMAWAETPVEADPAVAYRSAVADFASGLQGELQAAMKEGGPLAAISVCNTKAGYIAEEYAAKYGWQMSRTSLKLRNPDNAPSDYARAILENWQAAFQAGDNPAALESLETIEIDGEKKQVFMKGIGIAAVCTTCHGGADIMPEVAEKITALYPEDQARDYKEGDLRGAFVIVAPVE
jgi:hypothetical protein